MIMRLFVLLVVAVLPVVGVARQRGAVVVDSVTELPLPSASVFDSKSKMIGMTSAKGRMPYISDSSYPVTLRYMGYDDKIVVRADADTIRMQFIPTELDEVMVESGQRPMLHMLAYVREYSTLSTFVDTVFLFREKMVDYMINTDEKVKFEGWSYPRILKSKSYYKMSSAYGVDSVSDKCNYHFSWSDWMGINIKPSVPAALRSAEVASDTLFGKYSPTEIWTKNKDKLSIDVNVLADMTSRKWVSNLEGFFQKDLDFENFRVRFNYDNVMGDTVTPLDLKGYSFNIESNGRGHEMFKFNRSDQPFYVSTYAEVYIMDKEFISLKEAKKWKKHKFGNDELEVLVATDAPDLQPFIKNLIARVDGINRDRVRVNAAPDHRLIGHYHGKMRDDLGSRALNIVKAITGISAYKAHKNREDRWKEFTDERKRRK